VDNIYSLIDSVAAIFMEKVIYNLLSLLRIWTISENGWLNSSSVQRGKADMCNITNVIMLHICFDSSIWQQGGGAFEIYVVTYI